MSKPLLSIQNYSLTYQSNKQENTVLKAVNLDIAANEVVGLVGESGSGKSTLAYAIMRYLPKNALETGDHQIIFDGNSLIELSEKEMEHVRGNLIAMVFSRS